MAPPSAPSRGTIPRSAAVNRSVLLRLRKRERDAGSALPLALDDAPLALGAADERVEIDAGESRVVAANPRERPPHRPLALDAEREDLELDDAAQRRVAGDPAVELEPPPLLRRPAGPDLQRVPGDAQTAHDVDQRVAVLRDLGREPLERRLEVGAAVRAERAAGELEPGGRAGEVVVEVDGDEAAVHAVGHTRSVADRHRAAARSLRS